MRDDPSAPVNPEVVFFDLGSTLWDDYPAELHMWEYARQLLADYGISVSHDEILAKTQSVIHSFCPSLTRATVWQLTNGDRAIYNDVLDKLVSDLISRQNDPAEFKRLNPLFPGIHELLSRLKQHYRLGVISQHFKQVKKWLTNYGLEQYFEHLAVSGDVQLYKPDPRLYLSACQAMSVDPKRALMVGDRLDNDIWPANRIGMLTVRVLSDPYRIQQPRYNRDLPDYTIECTTDLAEILL
ncbi:HAD family hydrolase [bacterium]|nr:HAD family hydrolase [bacterium]